MCATPRAPPPRHDPARLRLGPRRVAAHARQHGRAAHRGVDAVKADVFIRGTNISLYAMQHRTFAARVYRLIANTDVSLHVYRDRNGTQQGVSLARVFGDSLELHGEVARRHAVAG